MASVSANEGDGVRSRTPYAASPLAMDTPRESSDSSSSRTRRLDSSLPRRSGSATGAQLSERREGDVVDTGKAQVSTISTASADPEGEPSLPPSGEKSPTAADSKLVSWESPDDVKNPQNWSLAKKWQVMIVVSSCSLCVTCNSSIVASNYDALAEDFHVGRTVAILGLSLFVTGLGLGPLFLGPFSEAYGRRPIYLVSFALFTLLQFPVAFANNVAVFMIFRFLVGMAGSAFLSVAGGTVVDMFSAYNLLPAMCVYTGSPFGGPALGPLIGNFIVTNTSWRWVWWTTIIWSSVQYLLIVFLAPETYGPKLLTLRAKRLRKETGDESLYSAHEEMKRKQRWGPTIKATLSKVPLLVVKEPMLLALCLWSALLLGILYAFFQAYPIVFEEQHGFTASQTGIAFLGQTIGMIIALSTVPFWSKLYQKASDRNGGTTSPEERLPMCMVGSFLTVIGLFIFAFTSYASVHWSGAVIGSVFFGGGILYIYAGVFTYTTNCWKPVAASAMAANSLIRSSFAAIFPLFTTPMYRAMGTDGATAMLAALNVLMIPIPFVLYKYGARIRARSSFTMQP